MGKYNKDDDDVMEDGKAAADDVKTRQGDGKAKAGDAKVAAKPTATPVGPAPKIEPSEAELKLGRLIWPFILASGEISVGPSGEWNHLTFDELMSIPEERVQGGAGLAESRKANRLNTGASDASVKPRRLPKLRPRLYVGEDIVWKTLTGHGIDFKRVPPLEWKLLVVIGSTREDGILQGDAVRATGQDKRSVPRRTDFLSLKGYIVKRTHMVRGLKTSKLWLTKFAPELPAPSNPLHGLDMSPAILAKDMEPVPWMNQWVGNTNKQGNDEIAYNAFGHTILAIIKAWGTVRVRDLKKKLGILRLKWQMKVMSKFIRKFDSHGYIQYVAATFSGSNFVYKDCVKFLRAPTDQEWRELLSSGKKSSYSDDLKTRMSRHKKKKKKKKGGRGRKPAKFVKPKIRVLKKRARNPPRPAVSIWCPEKPIGNTIAEFVLTGAAQGYTSPEISRAIAGPDFCRYFLKHLQSSCVPDIQPASLPKYLMNTEKIRTGKVNAWAFTCTGAHTTQTAEASQEESVVDPTLAASTSNGAQVEAHADTDPFGFASVNPAAFEEGTSDLTGLVRVIPARPMRFRRSYKRRQYGLGTKQPEVVQVTRVESEKEDVAPASPSAAARPRGRSKKTAVQPDTDNNTNAPDAAVAPAIRPRKRRAAQRVSYLELAGDDVEALTADADGEPSPKRRATENADYAGLAESEHLDSEDSENEDDRSKPGVYFGIPGSLNPNPKKKGRPRKSIVMIFRSDKIKDPNYLPGWSNYPRPRTESPLPAETVQPRKIPLMLPMRKPDQAAAAAASQPVGQEQPQSQDQIQEVQIGQPGVTQQQSDHAMVTTMPEVVNTIVVQNNSAGDKILDAQGKPSTAVEHETIPQDGPSLAIGTPSSDSQFTDNSDAATKKRKNIRNDKPGKYICDKCGGEWANDNGLLYHLEKGKNLCNPYYAAHPEEMERSRPNRSGRAWSASPEPGADSGSESSSSNHNSITSGSLVSEPAPSPPTKKRKVPKKARFVPRLVISSESEQEQRPVLKQRSILKNRRLEGSGVVPRGVQASEAVAQETAAAKPINTPQDTIAVAEGSNAAEADHNGATPAPEDDDEPLPYLKQIQPRPKIAKSAGVVKPPKVLKPRVSKRSALKKVAEVQSAVVGAFPEATLVDSTQAGPSSVPNQASNALDMYPVEALDPALRANVVSDINRAAVQVNEAWSTPAKTLTGGATASESLPENRDDSTYGIQSAPAEFAPRRLEVDNHGQPTFCMPPDAYTAEGHEGSIERALPLRSMRIQKIIKYLLDINGVFPTDRPLFYAVLKIYIATFGAPPYPAGSGCTRAVTLLASQRVLKQETVAIRPRGKWKSLNLIMRPEVEVTHALVTDLKMKTKNADPEMYVPTPFEPTEEEKRLFQDLERPSKKRSRGTGRRDHKLAEGIEILDAPFYAEKGMAGVRPNFRGRLRRVSEDEEGDVTPKRRSTKNGNAIIRRKRKPAGGDLPPAKKRRRGRRPPGDHEDDFIVEYHKLSIDGSEAANPGISSLPPSFFSVNAIPSASDYFAPTEVQFLVPNTQLDDDYIPEPEPENATTPSNESVVEDEEPPEPVVEPGTYSKTIELSANSKGVWPKISLKWFENNEVSFTMKGWLPGQTDMLMENLPKTMEQMAYKITSHSKTENWADPYYGDFCTSVDGCQAYELSDQGKRQLSGSIAPNYLFMNFSPVPSVSNMSPVKLEWLDDNEWTLETIPYEMLEDDDVEPSLKFGIIPTERAQKRTAGRPRTKPRSETAPKPVVYKRRQIDPNVREVKMQRELTSYPQTPDEYFRAKGQNCLGVDWKSEDTRIAAYVAVSTLTGGINKAMDWGLMMRLFPESKLSNLRKFWSMIKKEREGFIINLAAKFQEEFLEAYDSGDLPPFDFANPLDYDWPRLVKWTLALVVREGINLPATRKQFDDDMELVFTEKADFDWRETYHNWQRSVFNKFQDSTSESASQLLESTKKMEDNDVITARSWVRALCSTEADQYTPYQIRDKFLTLTRDGQRSNEQVSSLLESAIFDLEHRRIAIKQKSSALTTGRPYKLNEHFSRTLDRYSNEDKFTVAGDFKLRMDEAFRRGESVDIPWRTEDGMMIAALNMQAHGRVHIEPVKRLDIPFGFKPAFYESRKFPKTYYRFDIHIVPTPAYLYNEDIEVLARATAQDNIPAETDDGKLPMWCDFFGRPDRHRWFKMLAGVFFMLATRGAMTDDFAAQALKPCFEEFEIETIRKWGLKEGLLAETTVPGGAVTVTEWWWLVLASPMLELSTAEQASQEGGRRTRDQYAEWASGRSRRRGKYRMIH